MRQEIWVVADHDRGKVSNVTFEILGEARDLARHLDGKVCAILIGNQVQGMTEAFASYGADTLYLIEHELLADYVTDTHATAMAELVRQHQPSIIIFGATSHGSDLAAGLAARLKSPIATDCVKLELSEKGALMATRPSCADQVYVKLVFIGEKPYLATMRPGVIGTERPDDSRSAEVVEVKPSLDTDKARIKLKRRFKPDPATLPLNEAEIIVAAGGGASTGEDWASIEELARLMGAPVGGSRVAADRGFIPAERVIGQSGAYVAPGLYIGIGISGAAHHTCGMKDAGSILAINKDRGAPIFNIADLKVMADLHRLLPELNEELRRAKTELKKDSQ